ncbi:MAG: PEGA domain-containing protein [Sandaracinaceae bacterium]|nr:PEGA domain-containing protein [Sandaracinaceae bacterium]
MQRGRTFIGLFLLVACTASSALADDRWIVVEARGEQDAPSPIVERVRRVLRTPTIAIIDRAEAQAVLGRNMIAPVTEIPDALRTTLAQTAERALEEVARGHNARTREMVSEALSQVGDLLPFVTREVRPRRDIGDLCLFSVRAHLNEQHDAEAHAGVLECLRMIPDLQPPPDLHPPEVRDLVTAVHNELSASAARHLYITSRPASAHDCPVYVNGTRVGQTPTVSLPIVPGKYFVQVECVSRHPVPAYTFEMPERADGVFVGYLPMLRAALATEPDIHLAYRAGSGDEPRRLEDAYSLVGSLGIGHAIVVAHDGNQVTLTRVDRGCSLPGYDLPLPPELAHQRDSSADDRELRAAPPVDCDFQSVSISQNATDDEIDEALDHLHSFQEPQVASGAPTSLVLGVTSFSIGMAGLLTNLVFYGLYVHDQRRLDVAFPTDPDYADRLSSRNFTSALVMGVGAASATLLTASMPLLLPSRDGMPWWSWVAGGAGLALATTGIILAANDNSHLSEDQMHFERTVPLGPTLAMYSVPLLAIPLTYACRSLFHDDASHTSASLSLNQNELSLSVQGSF